jgi:hypothetical protein
VAWAAHAFVGLGLRAEDPYWTAAVEPARAPRGRRPDTLAAGGAGLLATGSGTSTALHNARSGHPSDIPGHDYAATYGKLTYRSHFPFDIPVGGGAAGSDDAIVAIETGDDGAARSVHRNESIRGSVGPSWIRTDYRLATRRPSFVRTIVLLVRDLEIRITRVVPGVTIRLRDGGAAFGTDADAVVDCHEAPAGDTIALSGGERVVAIRRLAGYGTVGVSTSSADRINLVHDRSIHPWVEETNPSRSPRVVASATIASVAPVDAIGLLAGVTFRGIGNDEAEIVVSGSGGTVARVVLGAHPPTSVVLEGRTIVGPSIRVAIVAGNGSAIAGERISSVAGVFRLARPGVVAVSRDDDGVAATIESGLVLDEQWAGPDLTAVRVRDGSAGFGERIPLTDAGVVPDALVRRLARRAGSRLITLRFERR